MIDFKNSKPTVKMSTTNKGSLFEYFLCCSIIMLGYGVKSSIDVPSQRRSYFKFYDRLSKKHGSIAESADRVADELFKKFPGKQKDFKKCYVLGTIKEDNKVIKTDLVAGDIRMSAKYGKKFSLSTAELFNTIDIINQVASKEFSDVADLSIDETTKNISFFKTYTDNNFFYETFNVNKEGLRQILFKDSSKRKEIETHAKQTINSFFQRPSMKNFKRRIVEELLTGDVLFFGKEYAIPNTFVSDTGVVKRGDLEYNQFLDYLADRIIFEPSTKPAKGEAKRLVLRVRVEKFKFVPKL